MLTQTELIASHKKRRAEDVSTKTIQNETSYFRRFMDLLGLQSPQSDCSWLAKLKDFNKHVRAVRKNFKNEAALSGFRSALQPIRRTACLTLPALDPAQTLYRTYVKAVNALDPGDGAKQLMGVNQFIKHCFNATGIRRSRLNAKRILVHQCTYDRIKALEDSLSAPGELTKFLVNLSAEHSSEYRTPYSHRVSLAVKCPYGLRFEDWPRRLQDEWDGLYLLRTNPVKAKHVFSLPRLNPEEVYTWRIRRDDQGNPSAKKQKYELELFFGWCLKPKTYFKDGKLNLWRSGAGLKKRDLSLARVVDTELVEQYHTFRKARTVTEAQVEAGDTGVYNHSCTLFCQFVSSLLNPKVGYIFLRRAVYFNPSKNISSPQNLARRVPKRFYDPEVDEERYIPEPKRRWFLFCNSVRSYVRSLDKQANKAGQKVQTRDPKDPIAQILDLDRPIAALRDLLNELERSEPEYEFWKHLHRRTRLFFEMICRCPLRIRMFAEMTPTNLVQKKVEEIGGRRRTYYQISFHKSSFKNERYIKEADYSYDLPSGLTPLINDYFNIDWPALHGRPCGPSDRVFLVRQVGHCKADKLTDKIIAQLTKTCYQATRRHLGPKYHTPGFRPHAIRHILATGVIKFTGSYERAALLLWDDIKTVMKAYGHIKRLQQLAAVAFALENELNKR